MKQAAGQPISSEDLVGVPGVKQTGLILSQSGEKIELGVDLPVLDTLVVDPAEWLERRHAQLIAQSSLRGQDETILKVTSLGSILGGFILNSSPLGIAALCLGVVGYSSGVVIGRRLTGRFNLSPIGCLSVGDALDLVTADTRGDVLGNQADDERSYLNESERSELWLIDHHSGLVAEALSRFKPSARLLAYLKIRRMARRRRTVPQPQEVVNAVGAHQLLKAEQKSSPRQHLSPSTALTHLTGEPRPPAAPLPLKPYLQKALRLQGAEPSRGSGEDAPEPETANPPAPPPDPNAGLRIGFPESPVDIAQQIGARLSNLILFAKPRTGKGFTVSRASRHVQEIYGDCELYVIDPRNRPSEKEYWLHIPEARRLHFDISGFTYNAQEIVNRMHAFTVRFEESPARRKLLIIDEFKMLVRKLGPYPEVKRLIDYVISLSSCGSVGQAHESLGRFAWICSQDPQLSSLGFRNAGDRGSFEIVILFDGEKGIQMHVDLKNTGLIPNLPDWGQLQGLAANSESRRFFYSTATDAFRSIPVYEVNNVGVPSGKAHRRTVSHPQTVSSKAAKLQHLNHSFAAPLVSPAYQSNEDLFSRIDNLWKNDDPNQGTDVIDQAIMYLSQSNNKERQCLADLLDTVKRKALKAAGKGEEVQISIRELSGLSWAKKWSDEYHLLNGRKREEIEPWLQLAVQLGFLSRISNDDYFIHLS